MDSCVSRVSACVWWVELIRRDRPLDELVTHPSFRDYQLRVTDPELCDNTVKQHSGYLDISDGKHLFFWFVVVFNRIRAYIDSMAGSSNLDGPPRRLL